MSYNRKRHFYLFLTIAILLLICLVVEFSYRNTLRINQRKNESIIQNTVSTLTYTIDYSASDIQKVKALLDLPYLTDLQYGQIYSVLTQLYYICTDLDNYFSAFGYGMFYLKQGGDQSSCLNLYCNMSKYLMQISAMDEAIQMIDKAYEYLPFEKCTNPSIRSIAYELLAEKYLYNKEYDRAIEYVNKSNDEVMSFPNDDYIKYMYIKMGTVALAKVYFEKGNYSKASEIIAQFEDDLQNQQMQAVQFNVWDFYMPIYYIKLNLALINKQYSKALEYLQIYNNFCDKFNFPSRRIDVTISVIDRLPPSYKTQIDELAYGVAELNGYLTKYYLKQYTGFTIHNFETTVTEYQRHVNNLNNKRKLLFTLSIYILIGLVTIIFISILYNESKFDPLTRLQNRKFLTRRINFLNNSHKPYSAIMIDIDHFKQLNDTYGHAFGDVVLRKVCSFISAQDGSDITSYRYGGEEMVMLITSVDVSKVVRLAETIRIGISSLSFENDTRVTASLGVGFSNHGSNPVEEADANMYYAKRHGRNFTAYTADGIVHLAERRLDIRS